MSDRPLALAAVRSVPQTPVSLATDVSVPDLPCLPPPTWSDDSKCMSEWFSLMRQSIDYNNNLILRLLQLVSVLSAKLQPVLSAANLTTPLTDTTTSTVTPELPSDSQSHLRELIQTIPCEQS